MVGPESDFTIQLILFLPCVFLRCDQRTSALPIESELIESFINPELGLADTLSSTLPDCHRAFSFTGRKRLEKSRKLKMVSRQELGCFIFGKMDWRGGLGPVQKGFAREYRDALHINIRNGPACLTFPSQHH